MAAQRLRHPCEHNQYDDHFTGGFDVDGRLPNSCPGGEFLPEDAIVIEKENGDWPQKWCYVIEGALSDFETRPDDYHGIWGFLLDALAASQVGEPG